MWFVCAQHVLRKRLDAVIRVSANRGLTRGVPLLWGFLKTWTKATPQVTPIAVASATLEPAPASHEKAPKRRHRSVTSPPVARIWLPDRETQPPSRSTKRQHAGRLLRWVHTAGFAGNFVLSLDLKKIYPVMCEHLGWKPYAWQTLAPEMRELTGGKKTYKWVDGERRRVYFIAPTMAKDSATDIETLAA